MSKDPDPGWFTKPEETTCPTAAEALDADPYGVHISPKFLLIWASAPGAVYQAWIDAMQHLHLDEDSSRFSVLCQSLFARARIMPK